MSRKEFPALQSLININNKSKIVLKIKLADGKECYVRSNSYVHDEIEKQAVVPHESPLEISSSYTFSPNIESCKNDGDLAWEKHNPQQIYLAQEMGNGDVDRCRTANMHYEKEKNSSQTGTKCGHECVGQTEVSQSASVQSCNFQRSHYDSSTTWICSPTTQNVESDRCPRMTSKKLSLETTKRCGLKKILFVKGSQEDWPAVSSSNDSIVGAKPTKLGNNSVCKKHACYGDETEVKTDKTKSFNVGQNKQSGTIASASVTKYYSSSVPSTSESDAQGSVCPESETKEAIQGGTSSSSHLPLNGKPRLCGSLVLGLPQSGGGTSGDDQKSCPKPQHVFIKLSSRQGSSMPKAAVKDALKDTFSHAEKSKNWSCKEYCPSASDFQGSICPKYKATDMSENAASSSQTLSLNKQCCSPVSYLPHATCEKSEDELSPYSEEPFVFIKSNMGKEKRTDIFDPGPTQMLSSPQDANHETSVSHGISISSISTTAAVKSAQDFEPFVAVVQHCESLEAKKSLCWDGIDAIEKNCGKEEKKMFDYLVDQTDGSAINNSEEMARYTIFPKHQVLPQEKLGQMQKDGKLEPRSRSEMLCGCGLQFSGVCNSSKLCVKCGKRRFRFQSAAQMRAKMRLAETHIQTMPAPLEDHTYCIPHTEARKQSWESYNDICQTEDTCVSSGETNLLSGQVQHVSSSAETGEREIVGGVAVEKHLNISFSKAEGTSVFADEQSQVPEDLLRGTNLGIHSDSFDGVKFDTLSPPLQHRQFSVVKQSPVLLTKCCYVVIDRLKQTALGSFRPSTSCNRYCREECLEFLCLFGSLTRCLYSAQFEKPEKEDCTSSCTRLCMKQNSAKELGNAGAFLPLSSLCGEGNTEVRITSSSIEVATDSCNPGYNKLDKTKTNSHENNEDVPSKKQKAAPKKVTKTTKSYNKPEMVDKDAALSCSIDVSQVTDLKKIRCKKTLGKMFRVSKFNFRYYVFEAMGRAFFVPLLKGKAKVKLDAEDLLFVKRTILQLLKDKRMCARRLEYPECLKHKTLGWAKSAKKLRKQNSSSLFLPSIANLDVESLEAMIKDGKLSKLIPRTSGQTQVEYLEQIGQFLHSYLMGSESNAGDWIKAVAKDIVVKQKRGKGTTARRLRPSKNIAIEIDIANDADDIDVGEENIWTDAVQQGHFSFDQTGSCPNEMIPSGQAGDNSSGSDSFDVCPQFQHEASQQSSSEPHTGSFVCEEMYAQETKPLLGEIIGVSVFTGGYQENEQCLFPRQQTNGPLLLAVCEQTQYSASQQFRTQGQGVTTPLPEGLLNAVNLDLDGHAVSGDDGVFNKSNSSTLSEYSNHPETKCVISETFSSTSVQLPPIAFTGRQNEQMDCHQQMDFQSHESQRAALSYTIIKQEPPCENFCHAWPDTPQENSCSGLVDSPDTGLPFITSVSFGEEAAHIASSAEFGESEDASCIKHMSNPAFVAETSAAGEEFSKSDSGISMEFLNRFSGSTKGNHDRAECANFSSLGRPLVSADDKSVADDVNVISRGDTTPIFGDQSSKLSGWLSSDVSLHNSQCLPTSTTLKQKPAEEKTPLFNNPDTPAVQFYGHIGAFSFDDGQRAENSRYVQGVPVLLEHSPPVLAVDIPDENLTGSVNSGSEQERVVAEESQYSEVSGNAQHCGSVEEGSAQNSPDENSFHHDSCDDFFEDGSDESDGELKGAIQGAISSVFCDSSLGVQNEARLVAPKNEEGDVAEERVTDVLSVTNWASGGDQAAENGTSGVTSSAAEFCEGTHSSEAPFALLPLKTAPQCKRGSKRKARSKARKRGKRRPAKKSAPLPSASALVPGLAPQTLKAEACLDGVVVPDVCTGTETSPSSVPRSADVPAQLLPRLSCRVESSSAAADGNQNSQADARCQTPYVYTQKIADGPVRGSKTYVQQEKGLSTEKQERSLINNVVREIPDVAVIEMDEGWGEDAASCSLGQLFDTPNTEPRINVLQQAAERSSAPKCKSRRRTSKRRQGAKRMCSKAENVSRVSSGIAFCLEPSGAVQLSEEPKRRKVCSVFPVGMVSDETPADGLRDQSLKPDVTAWHGDEECARAEAGDGLMGALPHVSDLSMPSADVCDGNFVSRKPVRDRERSFFDCLPESFLEAWKT